MGRCKEILLDVKSLYALLMIRIENLRKVFRTEEIETVALLLVYMRVGKIAMGYAFLMGKKFASLRKIEYLCRKYIKI
jgi:hypothetical protein